MDKINSQQNNSWEKETGMSGHKENMRKPLCPLVDMSELPVRTPSFILMVAVGKPEKHKKRLAQSMANLCFATDSLCRDERSPAPETIRLPFNIFSCYKKAVLYILWIEY